jgi:hypothetical protein
MGSELFDLLDEQPSLGVGPGALLFCGQRRLAKGWALPWMRTAIPIQIASLPSTSLGVGVGHPSQSGSASELMGY